MISKFIDFFREGFSRNLFKYVLGIGAGHIVGLLFQILLRRIYTTDDFGHYALFTSMVGIITTISALRYERAILLPSEEEEAYRLLLISVFFTIIVIIVISLIICIFPVQLASFFNVDMEIYRFFYLIPLSGFLFSLFRSIEFYMNRKKAYSQLGLSKVIRRVSEGGVQTIAGKTGYGLFLGDIFGHFFNLIFGVAVIRRDIIKYKNIKLNIKKTALKYIDFPKYNLWTALAQELNTVILPVFLISYLFGPSLTGSYDLSRLLLSLPLAMLTVAIQQIFYRKVSQIVNAGETVWPIIKFLFKYLVLTAFTGLILFFLFIHDIIPLFGLKWISSIHISKILITAYIFRFIFEPFSSFFFVFRKLKTYSLILTIYFLGIIGLFLMPKIDFDVLLILLVFMDLLFYLFFSTILISMIKNYEASIVKRN
ncbi:MAG: oligosaccharide flippase family protein [Bacteroidales bacterium]